MSAKVRGLPKIESKAAVISRLFILECRFFEYFSQSTLYHYAVHSTSSLNQKMAFHTFSYSCLAKVVGKFYPKYHLRLNFPYESGSFLRNYRNHVLLPRNYLIKISLYKHI